MNKTRGVEIKRGPASTFHAFYAGVHYSRDNLGPSCARSFLNNRRSKKRQPVARVKNARVLKAVRRPSRHSRSRIHAHNIRCQPEARTTLQSGPESKSGTVPRETRCISPRCLSMRTGHSNTKKNTRRPESSERQYIQDWPRSGDAPGDIVELRYYISESPTVVREIGARIQRSGTAGD